MSWSVRVRPSRCELSAYQSEKIRDRLSFWFQIYTGSLFVLIAGMIIIAASLLQLFSLAATQDPSVLSLLVGILLSYFAVYVLKAVIPVEELLVQTEYNTEGHNLEHEWPGNLLVMLLLVFSAVLAAFVIFEISSTVADYPIKSSYQATISGSEELRFIFSLILHLLYAGAIVTLISSVVAGWYLIYQIRKGLRYWLRRINRCVQFALLSRLFGMDESFEEFLGGSCRQCFGDKFQIITINSKDKDPTLICSKCGLNKDIIPIQEEQKNVVRVTQAE